jgi:hypothetical protein
VGAFTRAHAAPFTTHVDRLIIECAIFPALFGEQLNRRLQLKKLVVDEGFLGVGPVVLGIGEALRHLFVEPVVGRIDQQAVLAGHKHPVAHRWGVTPT